MLFSRIQFRAALYHYIYYINKFGGEVISYSSKELPKIVHGLKTSEMILYPESADAWNYVGNFKIKY